MIEFKQIKERGPRTIEGKDYFTIYAFIRAHENFDDPAWNGDQGEIIVTPPTLPRSGDPQDPADPPSDLPEPQDPGDPPDTPEPHQLIEIKLADDHIVDIAATTFLGPDGKPISAQGFIKRMFGDLPEFFKGEDELRSL